MNLLPLKFNIPSLSLLALCWLLETSRREGRRGSEITPKTSTFSSNGIRVFILASNTLPPTNVIGDYIQKPRCRQPTSPTIKTNKHMRYA
jgi:hypothetical protein